MALKPRKTEQLREQSKHVLYEIQMFYALASYLETGEVDVAVSGLANSGLPVRNAVVEAFEIHARQMVELLTHQRNRGYAVARDWAVGWSVPESVKSELK